VPFGSESLILSYIIYFSDSDPIDSRRNSPKLLLSLSSATNKMQGASIITQPSLGDGLAF